MNRQSKIKTIINLSTAFVVVLLFISCSPNKPTISGDNKTKESCLFFKVKYNDKYGYISNCDSVFIPFKFDEADDFSEGMARVKVETKWGFINGSEYAINPQYDDALPFSDGLAAVKTGDLWGYIDNKGNFVIEPKFEYAGTFCEGLACVSTSSDDLPKWGFIDKTGEFVIKPQFEWAQNFSEGLAPIQVSFLGKWGYIDKTGKIVIDPQFEDVSDFCEGLAAVESRKGEWGYINHKGEYVIKPQKAWFALNFSCGIGWFVQKNPDKNIFVDTTGTIVNVNFNSYVTDGVATTIVNDKYGFIDKQGNIIINPQFDEAYPFNGEYAVVRSDNRWGIIDKKGNVQWKTTGMNPIE